VLRNVSTQPLSEYEFKALVDTFDRDGNGLIDYNEFANLMQHFLDGYIPRMKTPPTRMFSADC
jgi:Ca2+-binding EF-hand superfamily protein